jgi:uncharacterized membrane protein YjdF
MKHIIDNEKFNDFISWLIRALLVFTIVRDILIKNYEGLFIVILTLILTFYPNILERRFRVYLPSSIQVIITLFIFAAQYLGEIRNFYERFWWWDIMLHTTSGFVLGIIGFMFVYLLNKNYDTNVTLSPIFIALFAFCFAVMIGAIWEIYEFGMDRLVGFNMQKFREAGQDGLIDTMVDLIVDSIGALVVSVLGYLNITQNKQGSLSKTFSSWFK